MISLTRHFNSINHNLSRQILISIMRGMCKICFASGVSVSLNEENGMTICDNCMSKNLKT